MTTVMRMDPSDSGLFDELYSVYAGSFDRDFDQPYGAVEKRIRWQSDEYIVTVVLLARDDAGVAVGGAFAQLPQTDNTGFAYVEVFVLPQHRRRGYGRTLLDELGAVVHDAGRTTMLGEAVWDVDDTSGPGGAFADACGFTLDIVDAVRELVLPASLPPLVVDPAYELRSWRGACPAELIEAYADVRRLMVQEAPSGDSGLENEQWDASRVRHEEQLWVEQDRVPQVSVALASDGTLVGHTQLLFPAGNDQVFQWDTLVLPGHRGHGLGLALKVFTMQRAADLLDGRRRIHTWNAAGNSHMIAVNDAMGFRQMAWAGEYVRAT